MSEAIKYAGLVGKYVRMERPQTEAEQIQDPHAGPTVGMECTVVMVADRPDGAVAIVADYGYEFLVKRNWEEAWTFHIWPDEETYYALHPKARPPKGPHASEESKLAEIRQIMDKVGFDNILGWHNERLEAIRKVLDGEG